MLAIDVTKTQTITAGLKDIIAAEGRIDILINNAGYGVYGSVEDIAIDDAKKQYDVNVFGLGEMIKYTLPRMRKQQSGLIINIASIAGQVYMPLGGWYHSSKFAVEGLSDCLRTELAPFGIRVVMIEPSAITTQFGNRMIPELLETSQGGAYQDQAQKIAAVMEGTTENGKGLPPQAVVDKIITAIESKNPRHRYVVGGRGKIFIFLKHFLGTRIFDRLVALYMK